MSTDYAQKPTDDWAIRFHRRFCFSSSSKASRQKRNVKFNKFWIQRHGEGRKDENYSQQLSLIHSIEARSQRRMVGEESTARSSTRKKEFNAIIIFFRRLTRLSLAHAKAIAPSRSVPSLTRLSVIAIWPARRQENKNEKKNENSH